MFIEAETYSDSAAADVEMRERVSKRNYHSRNARHHFVPDDVYVITSNDTNTNDDVITDPHFGLFLFLPGMTTFEIEIPAER